MNIKEAEKLTGISKRNIRFYEQKGMLHPARNQDNDYRDYSSQDIERLKLIRALRMVDMPLEDIQKVLNGERSLEAAAMAQERQLRDKAQEVQTAIWFCRSLSQVQAGADVDRVLRQMEQPENIAHLFSQWVEDYRELWRAYDKLKFTYIPDAPVRTPREFTAALCEYARENDVNLVITKEGMHPEFTLDGIEYTAQRHNYTRMSPVGIIQFDARHPEKILPFIPKSRRRIMDLAHYGWSLGMTLAVAILLATTQGPELRGTLEGVLLATVVPVLLGVGLVLLQRCAKLGRWYNLKNR